MRWSPETPEGRSLPGDLPNRLAILALLTIVYFAAGKIGLGLAFVHASASAVWPATGIALAAFLLLGDRVWPAILVGAFLVNLTTAGTVATSAAIAVGNTLEALIGAHLVNRFAGGTRAFDRVRDILRFVVAAGLVAIVRSAIALAHGMGLEVTAVGVESAAQLDFLKDLGCDRAQGGYFSMPVSPEELSERLGETWH